jgi:hypothetical protein
MEQLMELPKAMQEKMDANLKEIKEDKNQSSQDGSQDRGQ